MDRKTSLFLLTLFGLSPLLHGVDVNSFTTLNAAFVGNQASINFTSNIQSVYPFLYPINSTPLFAPVAQTTTIGGNGFTLSAGNQFRALLSYGGTVAISNLTISNSTMTGGAGGNGGGGGAGMGGGLFVYQGNTLTLTNVAIQNSGAVGGAGSVTNPSFGGGGGGGGGPASTAPGGSGQGGNGGGGGGGGFFFGGGLGSAGFTLGAAYGGGGGGPGSAGTTTVPNPVGGFAFDGVTLAGGAGGHLGGAAGAGDQGLLIGGGGGGGAPSLFVLNNNHGGNGAVFGGGGGGNYSAGPGCAVDGGFGGFGGGGGCGGLSFNVIADAAGGGGGFGGGGGAGGVGGGSQFGGGVGQSSHNLSGSFRGGGGAGLGGALFLMNGSTTTIAGTFSLKNNRVISGTGFQPGAAQGSDIFLMSGGTLQFALSSPFAMPSPIEGDQGVGGGTGGGLNQMGPAKLTLVGNNTYTGTTQVTGGALQVGSNGSLKGNVTVNGGTLTGAFSLLPSFEASTGSLSLTSGIVEPGVNSTGSISVSNQFNQTGGSLKLNLTSPFKIQTIKLLPGGSASLGGSANLLLDLPGGNYIKGTSYRAIDGPTTGTFSSVTKTGAASWIGVQLDYFPGPANGGVLITLLNTSLFASQQVDPGIPTLVSNYLISREEFISPTSDLVLVLVELGTLSDPALNQALIDMSPNTFGILEWIHARNSSQISDVLAQHRLHLGCNPRSDHPFSQEVWVAPIVSVMDNHKPYDDLYPFNGASGGALIGYDLSLSDCYLGGAFAYTKTLATIDPTDSEAKVDSYYGALYGSLGNRYLSLDASVLLGRSNQEVDRHVSFASIDRIAHSNHGAHFFEAHLGIRTDLTLGSFWIEPFALGNYLHLRESPIHEKGGISLDLSVREKAQNFARAEAGARTRYEVKKYDYCFAPYLGFSWVGEYPLHDSHERGHLSGLGGEMKITSYWSHQSLLSPQAGIQVSRMNGLSVLAFYKGLFNKDTRIHQGEFRVEWGF